MENRSHALLAGLFTLLLAAALLGAAVWLGGRQGPSYPYVVVSRLGVGGLNVQAAVHYRGVDVGRVERIGFDPSDPQVILIDVSLSTAANVTSRTYARLGSQGLTGISYVELDDDGKRGTPLPTSPAEPARIEMRPSALQEFGDAGQALLARVNDIAQRLNVLLNEDNQKSMSRSLASIEEMTRRFVSFQEKLEPTLDALPRLTDRADRVLARSESLVEEMRDLTREARQQVAALDRVGLSADRVGRVASDVYGSTLPRLDRLAERLAHTTENLDRLLEAQSREPQSLIFGPTPLEPGPGEPGFPRRPR